MALCQRSQPARIGLPAATLGGQNGSRKVSPLTLEDYRKKRRFAETPEPKGGGPRGGSRPIFVVHEHHARKLHYDLRLEVEGVLWSWAVPKGPSLDPAQKRLAVEVEDHPLDYADFEGVIPEGQYGAGTVIVWDRGTYENILAAKDEALTMAKARARGRLEVRLSGSRLRGGFALIRMRGAGREKDWLLIKMKDEFARPGEV
jgi:bifunctional non-homologous end joining protein LigD